MGRRKKNELVLWTRFPASFPRMRWWEWWLEIRVWSSSACLTDKKIGFFIYRVHFWKFNAVLDLDYCFFPQMWVDRSPQCLMSRSWRQQQWNRCSSRLWVWFRANSWALKFTHLPMGTQGRFCCCSSVSADFYLLPPRLRMLFVFQLSSVLTFLQTCFVPMKSYYTDI